MKQISPGASFTADKRYARWILLLFVVVGWLTSISSVFVDVLPPAEVRIVSLGCLFLYPILICCAIWAFQVRTDRLSRNSSTYLVSGSIIIFVLVFYGLLKGNAPRVIILDLLAFVPVVGGFLLGRRTEVWTHVVPVACILSGVSVVLAIQYTDVQILVDRSILNSQVGSHFESVLTLAPLLAIVTAGDKRSRWCWPLLIVSCGVVLVYLYFGRRGVSVRGSLEVLAAGVIVPLFADLRMRAAINAAFLTVFASAVIAYFPFDVLAQRYMGLYGVQSTLTVENKRFEELADLWEELSTVEVIIGRGWGGLYSVNVTRQGLATDLISGEDYGNFGTHAGVGVPILKGGICFLIYCFLPCFVLLRGLFILRRLDRITLAAVIACPIWLAFQFVDGSTSYSTPWTGFAIGMLFSRADLVIAPTVGEERAVGQRDRSQPSYLPITQRSTM